MKLDYFTIEGFENVYLEDSYVWEIKTNQGLVEFLLEVVLTENHPYYTLPKMNEHYCYKKAKISFPKAEKIEWVEKNLIPSKDATGEIDFGNIDVFFYEGKHYNLFGDWGHLKIQSAKPTIKFIAE